MTVYTDATNAKHAILASAVADTVTLGVDAGDVEILNRGTDYIYATTDSFRGPNHDGVPVVAGNNCAVIAPGSALQITTKEANPVSVSLISATSVPYSVTAVAG